MITVYVSGLPISAKDYLFTALGEAYGEGVVDIEEIGRDMLKAKVRMSLRNPNILLVILDSVSTDVCADIENGLYKSDKFYSYTNDASFVSFLNSKYGTNLEIPEDEEEEVSFEVDDLSEEHDSSLEEMKENYERQLAHKDFIIKNLRIRFADMQRSMSSTGDLEAMQEEEEKLETLKSENMGLRDSLLEEKARVDELSKKVKSLEESKEKDGGKPSNYDAIVKELAELRSQYSIQSSVIQSKESKLQEKDEKISDLEGIIKDKESEIIRVNTSLSQRISEIDSLKADLSSKDRDLVSYLKELASLKEKQISTDSLKIAEGTIESLRGELQDLSDENTGLKKKITDEQRRVEELEGLVEKVEREKDEVKEKIEKLEERIVDDNDTIAVLNKEKLELSSRLSVLERVNKEEGSDDLSEDIVNLRRELAELKDGVFGRIANCSLPNSPQRVQLVPGWNTGLRYNNLRFIFAGSAESRKGAYKCLLNELRCADPKKNFLIVDLVSETYVDYVFEITRVVPGLDWFRKGGSLQQYLSKTFLRNVQVLSCGLRYVNDSYFLCIDWEKRLRELEESGYQVMLFCGDISNMVGRIFHESFANLGISVIYIHGNATGSRSLLTNIRGISNSNKSIIGYYDFNPDYKKFYDSVAQTNKCKIISEIRK